MKKRLRWWFYSVNEFGQWKSWMFSSGFVQFFFVILVTVTCDCDLTLVFAQIYLWFSNFNTKHQRRIVTFLTYNTIGINYHTDMHYIYRKLHTYIHKNSHSIIQTMPHLTRKTSTSGSQHAFFVVVGKLKQ